MYLCLAIAAVGVSAAMIAPGTLRLTAPVEPFPNATRLAGNGLAMVAAFFVHCLLSHTVLAPGRVSRAIRRQAGILLAALAAMTVLLASAPLPASSPDFVAAYAGDPHVLGYVLLFCGYVGFAAGQFIRLIHDYIRLSDRPWLRRGLTVVQIGAGFCVCWAIAKCTAAVVVYLTGRPLAVENPVSANLSAACIGLVAIGSTMPTWGPVAAAPLRWLRHHRAYRVLHPLWAALRDAIPEITQAAGESDTDQPRDIGWRLARRVIEIRDGLLLLAPYRDPSTGAAARPENHGRRPDPAAAAEAAEIAAALRARRAGAAPAVAVPRPPEHQAEDLAAETAWLRRVARAYRRHLLSDHDRVPQGGRSPVSSAEPVVGHDREPDGPGAAEPPARRTAPDVLARVITEVLAPWVIVLVLPLAVAWRATHSPGGMIAWGLLVSVTSSILPMGVIVWGARTGRWDGHHVRNRDGRLVPFLALIVSSTVGLALLFVLGAPWLLTALDISMLTSLFVTGAITARWKISMHAAVAAGAVVVLAVTYTPIMWALAPLVAAISWSRVRVRDHTTAQVVVGAIVGAAVGGSLYAALI
ncbi:MAB_1171c family putative transporter [Gandjariella thermophila]|uniref:DUF6545 domain-containing protein n=1 Tax=Gandjariella thermophila TaxID=1931992 RepID=A0A4D4J8F1_9PSEU|nr:MAB_1171c family putative transporter [Gandjariella thermophila]GDY30153.1 hypothetical protein GTS_17860 [Gandjariella thermophila]